MPRPIQESRRERNSRRALIHSLSPRTPSGTEAQAPKIPAGVYDESILCGLGTIAPRNSQYYGISIVTGQNKVLENQSFQQVACKIVFFLNLISGRVSSQIGEKLAKAHFHFIDLFAGCGGLALGLEQAGFKPLIFSEINPSAAQTYLINRPGTEQTWVRDVADLNSRSLKRKWMPEWERKGVSDVDLICGGPPCQGFSGRGHRRSYEIEKANVPSNFLYRQMVEIIKQVKPKIFLFENVFGLTFSRWTSRGRKGEIWAEIQEAFQSLPDYVVPRGTVIHAAQYGVPQNRPRVMIVGVRRDCRWLLRRNRGALANGFLPEPEFGMRPPHLRDVLDDLIDPDYLQKGVTLAYPNAPRTKIQRSLREKPDGSIGRKGERLMDQEYSSHGEQTRKKFLYMIRHEGRIPDHMKTRKFALRVLPSEWDERGPVVTVTSLPDDFVHFAQPRIPTVREWARMQTFPDWYEFRGPRTTGGMRRAGNPATGDWQRDAPRYTQIGNAVPVRLAFAIGQHFARILENRPNKPAIAA